MDSFGDERVQKIVMVSSSQIGKALALDTLIPTPDGWMTMGNLKPGDLVFDDNGKQCSVLACTEVMTGHKCYRVKFSDGSEIVADAQHVWAVDSVDEFPGSYRPGASRVINRGTRTTEEMAGNFSFIKSDGKICNRYAVQVAKPLECKDKELLIPPYTLGVWLGDGHSYSAHFCGHLDDFEIVENVRADGFTVNIKKKPSDRNYEAQIVKPWDENLCKHGHDMRIVGRTKKGYCAECSRQYCRNFQYGIPVDPVVKPQTFYQDLMQLNVLKNKHIPGEYLRASYEQRLELLQGLMDTDGTCGAKNGRCEITLANLTLAKDVSELLHSLGIKHTMKYRTAKCTSKGYECKRDAYRISFMVYDDVPVFKLKRKLERMISKDSIGPYGGYRRTTETFRRRIVDIQEVESVPVKCIAVDSPSHLYLAGRSMIPTHNSECLLNLLSYVVDQDPGSVMLIQPTTDDCKKFSAQRIAPMLRDMDILSSKVAKAVSRDSRNTMLQKQFPGGMLTLVGTNAPSALASTPVRYVFGDELDRWAQSAGTEGDPLRLAEARQATFYNKKTVFVSTPTIKDASKIAEQYELGTKERWMTQCPDCGEWSEITFDSIHYSKPKRTADNKGYLVEGEPEWLCPHCGVLHPEHKARKYPKKWVALNPDAIKNGVRSFWLNAFASPWKSWNDIFLAFLEAKHDPMQLQVIKNTLFGELWEARGDLMTEDDALARREEYGVNSDGSPVEVPDSVLYLTCGIDTQDNRLEYEVKGWGHSGESWGIKKGIVMGRPDLDEVWQRLDDVLDHEYKTRDGKRALKIRLAFIDSGGHFTQAVYEACRTRRARCLFPIKGKGGQDIPYTKPPSKVPVKDDPRRTVWLYTIGVDAGKTAIYKNLEVEAPGPGYCHYPLNPDAGYDRTYFEGLLSETLEIDKNGRMSWKIIPGHKRNEPLDIHNYALAASKLLNIDTYAEERRLFAQEKPQKKEHKTIRKRRVNSDDDW